MAKNWRAGIANVMSLIGLAIAGRSKEYHLNKAAEVAPSEAGVQR
jgi:hypothetical protein